MPEEPTPFYTASTASDGALAVTTRNGLTAVIPAGLMVKARAFNWMALFQILMTYGPQVFAIVTAIINGITPPAPPAPAPAAK